MSTEFILKNIIFVSLFASMLTFWIENVNTLNLSADSGSALAMPVRPVDPTDFPSLWESQQATINSGSIGSDAQVNKKIDFSSIFLGGSLFGLTALLLLRWVESGHPPLSSLYESLLFLLWNFLTIYFVLTPSPWGNSPPSIPSLNGNQFVSEDTSVQKTVGFLVSSSALFINTFAEWQLPDDMREIKSLIPALQSNWLLMHVSIMIVSYASLFLGCILSVTYLVVDIYRRFESENLVANLVAQDTPRSASNKPANGVQMQNEGERISLVEMEVKSLSFSDSSALAPSSTSSPLEENLDMLSYKLLSFGFPLLTLGILSGAIWANEAWGSYWSWDPKETWAFVTWLVFAFYLHTRLQYGWGGRKSAFVASFGFFIVWICYLGVNLLGKGLHSYGWIAS